MKRYIILSLCLPLFLVCAEKTATIKIEGMTCPLCTTAIKKSLKKVKGVRKAKVKLNTEMATVHYDENVTETALLDAIKKTGYKGTIISVK
jgi:mercuric ion binding protein